MDDKRPRGPEEQAMVPQGPEDAVEDGDCGELRRQVMKSACSELGGKETYIGGETLVMKSGCMFVYTVKVTKKAVERTLHCLYLLTVPCCVPSACAIGFWGLHPYPTISSAHGYTWVLATL